MTKHYDFIRREVYELYHNNPKKMKEKKKEMNELFTGLQWVLFYSTIISLFSLATLLLLVSYNIISIIWEMIPLCIIVGVLALVECLPERKLYKLETRKKYIEEDKATLNSRLKEVAEIIKRNGVKGDSLPLLKDECENKLTKMKNRTDSIIKFLMNVLVSAPLTAVIIMILDQDKKVNTQAVAFIASLVLLASGLVKLYSPVYYIINGSVKDQCLLDAINDLEYTEYFKKEE